MDCCITPNIIIAIIYAQIITRFGTPYPDCNI